MQDRVPADLYIPSTKRYPIKPRDPDYPDEYFIERVGPEGALRFQGVTAPLSTVLSDQLVGLRRIDSRVWEVFFGPVFLGVLNPKRFRPATRKQRPLLGPVLPIF